MLGFGLLRGKADLHLAERCSLHPACSMTTNPGPSLFAFLTSQKREIHNLCTKTEKQTRNHVIANDLETLMTPDPG